MFIKKLFSLGFKKSTANSLGDLITDELLKQVHNSVYFDDQWYTQSNPDVDFTHFTPSIHFLENGYLKGRNPSSKFSIKEYLNANPDVAKAKINPLVHFILYGEVEGRSAYPVLEKFNVDDKKNIELLNKTIWFNANWYVDTYPDLNIVSSEAAVHYYLFGSKEEKDPCPEFSTSFYLMCHSDVKSSGVNPLLHYINHGKPEKRDSVSSKYAKLALDGQLLTISKSASFACDFSHLHELDDLQGTKAPKSESSFTSISIGAIIAGDAVDESIPMFQTQIQLFEDLCQSYKVDASKIDAWESFSNSNFTEYLRDISIINHHSLRVRFESPHFINHSVLIEAYQFDINSLSVKSVSSASFNITSLNLIDVNLINNFQPVLLIFKSENQMILSQLIPFPSLLRGGPHFGELCVQSLSSSLNDRLISYSKSLLMDYSTGVINLRQKTINVSLQDVIGNEHVFDSSFMKWVKHYFNIAYSGWAALPKTELDTHRLEYLRGLLDISYERNSNNRINAIDKDTLPTLKLVTTLSVGNVSQGPAVIVPEALVAGPARIVKLASMDNDVSATWYCDDTAKFASHPSSVVQSRRERNDSNELIESARDQAQNILPEIAISMSILLIIKDNNQLHQARLWQTIENQKGIVGLDIVLGLDHPDDTNVYLPTGCNDHYQILSRKSDEGYKDFYLRCVRATKYELLTHTVESAMYYDDYSLAKLGSTILGQVKSSSCKLLNKKVHGKGYKLSQIHNALSLVTDVESIRLDSPHFDQSYYPTNQLYSVVAIKPLVVTYEKQQMLEFLSHYEGECDLNRLFIDFGIYLISCEYDVVFSNQVTIGVEIEDEQTQLSFELSEDTIALLSDLSNKVEECRSF